LRHRCCNDLDLRSNSCGAEPRCPENGVVRIRSVPDQLRDTDAEAQSLFRPVPLRGDAQRLKAWRVSASMGKKHSIRSSCSVMHFERCKRAPSTELRFRRYVREIPDRQPIWGAGRFCSAGGQQGCGSRCRHAADFKTIGIHGSGFSLAQSRPWPHLYGFERFFGGVSEGVCASFLKNAAPPVRSLRTRGPYIADHNARCAAHRG
jgi:hypothetical protein